MRRSTNTRTETIDCDPKLPEATPVAPETAFERPRGVSKVETRGGYCQVHVNSLGTPIMEERLKVLRALSESGISIDFMKLTPSGLSFLASEDRSGPLQVALAACGVRFSIKSDRSIVFVHAVNIRDEEGLIAEILRRAITYGTQMDHVGDGHDHLLLVVGSGEASLIAQDFKESLLAASPV